uniref:RNase H domain-containing protein n=1 Tax=Strongyloides papillosus TaxID=174720 RepID=A0A0N5C5T8_STREA
MNPVDLPPLTPLDSSNSVSSLSNVNNVPSYVKLDSQLSVEQYIKENDISIICSTDGSCESGRGLAYYIKYPKGEIEKSFRAGNNSSAQYLEITALHQCLVELSELNNKNEFPSSSKILIITDSDYGARALSTDLKKWLSCGFQKTDGKKLTHENIIKSSWELIVNLGSTIIIAGHKGIILNEKVDTMARRAAVRPVKQAVSFNF